MSGHILKARMQTLAAGHQIFCFQTKHERVDRSVFEPLVYGALRTTLKCGWVVKLSKNICPIYQNN